MVVCQSVAMVVGSGVSNQWLKRMIIKMLRFENVRKTGGEFLFLGSGGIYLCDTKTRRKTRHIFNSLNSIYYEKDPFICADRRFGRLYV